MGGLANDTRVPPENAPSTDGGGQGLLQWRVEHAGGRQDVDSQRRGSWSGGPATNNPDGGWGVRDTAVDGHIPEALAGKGYLTINSSLPLLSKSSTSMPVTPADSSRAGSPQTSASSSVASSLASDAAASCHSAPVAMQVRRNKSCPHNTECHCHTNPSIRPFSHPSADAPTNSATKQATYSPITCQQDPESAPFWLPLSPFPPLLSRTNRPRQSRMTTTAASYAKLSITKDLQEDL